MMGWRESYTALVELFPQVDVRLIKGAALEHREDVGAAADFIISEVLAPDESILEGSPKESVLHKENEVLPTGSSMTACAEPGADLSACDQRQSEGLSSKGLGGLSDGFIKTPDPAKDLHGERNDVSSSEMAREGLKDAIVELPSKELEGALKNFLGSEMVEMESRNSFCAIPSKNDDGYLKDVSVSRVSKQGSGITYVDIPDEAVEEGRVLSEGSMENIEVNGADCDFGDGHRTIFDGLCEEIAYEEVSQEYGTVAKSFQFPEDLIFSKPKFATEENEARVSEDGEPKAMFQEGLGGEEMELPAVSSQRVGGVLPEETDTFHEVSVKVTISLDSDNTVSSNQKCNESDLEILIGEETPLTRHCSMEDRDSHPLLFDSITVPGSACGGDGFAVDRNLQSMLSMDGSFMTTNAVDGGNWESVERDSINLGRMDTLDAIVEEAKADKEVLIDTIEEIRILRQKTDQAEDAARQSKDEAARGGVDVLAKVNELRQMLSRAREANAMHAGEIYGEKAVLATEARELQSRLQQVKEEKANALSALNEIKSSLQARIELANQECEAAELEKSAKEAVARDALSKEEALVARVAQESRELDAESEVCTKIREFLIDKGSIVDALQGEVAVLCEDAEALKRKDVDGMSLSCSGGYVHMLSRAGSDVFDSIVSESGKFTEFDEGSLRSLVQPEGGSISAGEHSISFGQGKVEKPSSGKKSWSPLPSLLGAFSGSQDLSNSSHSARSASTGKNSASGSRRGVIISPGEDSQCLSIDDIKYPSSQSSTSVTSPGIAQAEQELYEAQMAIFSGEDRELEYSGSCNLDIFRSDKPSEPNVGTDEEDWQVLGPDVLGKLGSGRSSS